MEVRQIQITTSRKIRIAVLGINSIKPSLDYTYQLLNI